MQLERLGGRGARQVLLEALPDLDVHRAEQPGPLSGCRQDLGAERGDGGLAVCAGDADGREVPAGLAEPQVGGVRERVAGVGHHELGNGDIGHLTLHDHCSCAGLDGVGHVPMSIGVLPWHREEERARVHPPRVVVERGDLADRHADHPLWTDAVRQRTEAHAPPRRSDCRCLAAHGSS